MNDKINLPTFKWAGDDYPVIATLCHNYKLVAHTNGPGITNGYHFSTLDQYKEDSLLLSQVKKQAATEFQKWIWPRIVKQLNTPKY